jgi:hypothetical protein
MASHVDSGSGGGGGGGGGDGDNGGNGSGGLAKPAEKRKSRERRSISFQVDADGAEEKRHSAGAEAAAGTGGALPLLVPPLKFASVEERLLLRQEETGGVAAQQLPVKDGAPPLLLSPIFNATECKALVDVTERIGFRGSSVAAPAANGTPPYLASQLPGIAGLVLSRVEPCLPRELGVACAVTDTLRFIKLSPGAPVLRPPPLIASRADAAATQGLAPLVDLALFLSEGAEGGELVLGAAAGSEAAVIAPRVGACVAWRAGRLIPTSRPVTRGASYILLASVLFAAPADAPLDAAARDNGA